LYHAKQTSRFKGPAHPSLLQKNIAAREEASLAHERAALQAAQELEARVAAYDAKEKAALRVGCQRAAWVWRGLFPAY
jgi:hypothetical protein